jgi:hypothetical protein
VPISRCIAAVAGVAAAFSVSLASVSGLAADTKGRFALHGVGAESCSQFNEDIVKKDSPTKILGMAWLTGYLSALNRVERDTYDVTPILAPDSLIEILVSICSKNPNARVESAADGMVKSLAPAKLLTESPVITLQSEAGKLEIHRETFVAAQDALIAKKYYKGQPEDKLSPALTAAFKAYQKDAKLKETGLPDTETVLHLILENPTPAAAKADKKKRH